MWELILWRRIVAAEKDLMRRMPSLVPTFSGPKVRFGKRWAELLILVVSQAVTDSLSKLERRDKAAEVAGRCKMAECGFYEGDFVVAKWSGGIAMLVAKRVIWFFVGGDSYSIPSNTWRNKRESNGDRRKGVKGCRLYILALSERGQIV